MGSVVSSGSIAATVQRVRMWETRVEAVELRIPKLRKAARRPPQLRDRLSLSLGLSIHRIVESHLHLEVDNFHAAGRCSLTDGEPAPYLRSTMVPRRMDSRGLIGNTVRTTQKGPKPWLPPQL